MIHVTGFEGVASGFAWGIQLINTLILLLLVIVLPIFLGIYVYRDAKKRGMAYGLWTAAVVFVPFCIGLIIYFIMRQNYSVLTCPACLAAVAESHILCPHCGNPLQAQCPQCQTVMDPSWQLCPQCGTPLSQMNLSNVRHPRPQTDKGGVALAVVLVAVPLLTVVLGTMLFMNAPTNTTVSTPTATVIPHHE